MFSNTKRLIFSLILSGVFLNSCVKDLTDDIDDLQTGDYTQNWIFPLINSDIQMTDLDTANIKVYSDGTVYYTSTVDSVFTIGADSIFDLNANQQLNRQGFKFENVNTADFSKVKSSPLSFILGQNFPLGNSLLSQSGTIANANPVAEGSFGTHNFPVINEITNVTYNSGLMDVNVFNGTNIPLTNVKLKLRNLLTGDVLGTVLYPSVDANSNVTQQINMGGKTLLKNVEFEIETLSSPGTSSPIVVNLSAPFEVKISSTPSMIVNTGTADFKQPIFDFNYHFEILDKDNLPLSEEITRVKLKQGVLKINMLSKLSAPMEFSNEIVGSTNGTDTIKFSDSFPIGNGFKSQNISLAGYIFDLTQNPAQPFNHITLNFAPKHIVSTINNVFNASDSIVILVSAEDLEYEYVFGRFGQQEFTLDSNLVSWDDEIFSNVSGNVQIKDSKINLHTQTNIGVELGGDIFGHVIDVDENTLDVDFMTPFTIEGPQITQFGNSVIEEYVYDQSNSNSDEIISFLPNSMLASGTFKTNLSNPNRECFVTDDGYAVVDVEFETPLHFKADTLYYSDTLYYDNEDLKDIADIDTSKFVNSVFLHLYMENQIPLNVNAQILVVDSLTPTKDSLLTVINYPKVIEAAEVDASGITVNSNVQKQILELSKEQRIFLENADKIVIKVGAITAKVAGNSPFVKIMEDDHFILNLSIEVQNHIPVE